MYLQPSNTFWHPGVINFCLRCSSSLLPLILFAVTQIVLERIQSFNLWSVTIRPEDIDGFDSKKYLQVVSIVTKMHTRLVGDDIRQRVKY